MSTKRKTRHKRPGFSLILLFVMAVACVVLAVIPPIREAAHPDTASTDPPAMFGGGARRLVMTGAALDTHETFSLIIESERSSAEEAQAAKKAAAEEKVSELAKKAAGEQADQAVYDKIRAEEERQIKDERYEIMGLSSVTAAQMAAHFNAHASYPAKQMAAGGAPAVTDFVQIIFDEATLEGVKPEVVYAQAMLETGWLRFSGVDSITQYNFAGLGTVGDGNPGNSFADVRTGIRAQVQHLKAYACTDDLVSECVDTRFNMVQRGCAPYIQWLGINENPIGAGWASGKNYGGLIMKMIVEIRSM